MNVARGVADSGAGPRRELAEKCTACGQCAASCLLLEEIGEAPLDIACRGATVEEAFSCSLCELCTAVCPIGLSPAGMFAAKRVEAIAGGEFPIDDYRYLYPDRELNICKLYREKCNIHYQELPVDQEGEVAFFPGCTMITYGPDLTRAAFHHLAELWPRVTFLTDCCGKPLYQMGLKERGENFTAFLKDKLKKLGVRLLVTACPNCFYELRNRLAPEGIEVRTIYENWGPGAAGKGLITIHDSCPDRHEGIFARQVRKALRNSGYQLVEMEHHGPNTFCCGSGGQISHFRPDLAMALTDRRLEEASDTGAGILAGYCLSCVLNFARAASGFRVRHVLDILLGQEEDYSEIKKRAKALFSGPEGEENWRRLMAE
ncbi:(Fe-S)-binding protein [Moorella sp. E306M]|uniref:(Fe-S)-binding protein n=1 Tax=Moorella sp. E306M TaxID=2572683 RepID=UPI0010FFC34B|nr:(Fe-S)-binding protein [Moorella sp. E306M]GEA16879.1 hypothetical protein E306M_00130 [Moorella sp. E306M]